MVASLPKVYPEVYQKVYPEVYQKYAQEYTQKYANCVARRPMANDWPDLGHSYVLAVVIIC